MFWIILTILLIILILFYYFLSWKSNKDLTKLRRKYDENGYKSEAERKPVNWRTGISNERLDQPKQLNERNEQPPREQLLQASNIVLPNTNSGEPAEDSTEKLVKEENEKK